MSTRVLVCLALTAALPCCWAGEVSLDGDLEPGGVRQLNPTRAHLEAMQPKEEPRKLPGATMARLVGKMLSSQVKGLNIELSEDPEPAAGLQSDPGVHFNRRAELVYDNYRVGIKRNGVMMRYEVAF